jgi:CheY-like chemotaxis protein
VLVVEDEPTVARLISDVLGEEGYPVEIVLDGEEGLRRALHGNYDLLICDLKMPHLDGRALHRELLAKGSPLQHRLVFVTGDTLAPRTMEFLESCGVPYLAKPFLVEELKAVVAAALESSGGGKVARRARSVFRLEESDQGNRDFLHNFLTGIKETDVGESVAIHTFPIRKSQNGGRAPAGAGVLIVCGDSRLTRGFIEELLCAEGPVQAPLAANLNQAGRMLDGWSPSVIFLDASALAPHECGFALEGTVASLVEHAPVVVAAPAEHQEMLAFLIRSGAADLVARVGNFLPVAASLVARRARIAKLIHTEDFVLRVREDDFGELLRHEVNNPLTGILGNAELLLERRSQFPPYAVARLETIAELAVRLRETIRRLSDEWESRRHAIHTI